jgi:hypothetical protein
MATFVQDDGLDLLVDRFRGSGVEPIYIGWGIGAGTTVRTDTTLFSERDVDLTATTGTRTTGTPTQQTTTTTGDTWQLTGTRTATGAGTVTNAGCFDTSTIGSGRMFLKGDFTGIGLASSDSISFTCKSVFDN